ncbi:hypothetical protein SDC9_169622 [bioreactor metagenome]|uniref:Uncharacterized protein n=1 Tax=bioreactor metagenome TaxID=1076179 RepID=A0A645G8W8_9ZZZZ
MRQLSCRNDVPNGVNAGDGGFHLVIDNNTATFIHFNTGILCTKIVHETAAANGNQHNFSLNGLAVS